MVADIRSIDADPEVVRLGRLIQTYQARITELSVQRDRGMMADGADDADQRAAAMLAGGSFAAPRSLASIADEMSVLKLAILRAEAGERDARAKAAVAITKEYGLYERAAAHRSAVAAGIDTVLAAMAESGQFVDQLDQAGLSAAGARWPGCGAPSVVEALASLRIDCGGIDAAAMQALQRRAGVIVVPVFSEIPEQPAPVKQNIRKRVADALSEVGEQMFT